MEIVVFSNWHLGTEHMGSTENIAPAVHGIIERVAKFKSREEPTCNDKSFNQSHPSTATTLALRITHRVLY